MPKTKFQEFIFTLITSGCMIFIMGVYNVAIHTGGFQAATFKHALHSFPLEWFIGLLCAFFIASKTSKYFAFRVAKPTDRPIFIILCIQTFTVCTMVPLELKAYLEQAGFYEVQIHKKKSWLCVMGKNRRNKECCCKGESKWKSNVLAIRSEKDHDAARKSDVLAAV